MHHIKLVLGENKNSVYLKCLYDLVAVLRMIHLGYNLSNTEPQTGSSVILCGFTGVTVQTNKYGRHW